MAKCCDPNDKPAGIKLEDCFSEDVLKSSIEHEFIEHLRANLGGSGSFDSTGDMAKGGDINA